MTLTPPYKCTARGFFTNAHLGKAGEESQPATLHILTLKQVNLNANHMSNVFPIERFQAFHVPKLGEYVEVKVDIVQLAKGYETQLYNRDYIHSR